MALYTRQRKRKEGGTQDPFKIQGNRNTHRIHRSKKLFFVFVFVFADRANDGCNVTASLLLLLLMPLLPLFSHTLRARPAPANQLNREWSGVGNECRSSP